MRNFGRSRVKRPAHVDGTRRRNAFSLIELIVTVAIIGVIAAIAVPRFSRGVESVGSSATLRELFVLQKQIELYGIEHGNVYPGAQSDGTNGAGSVAAFRNQLLRYSDKNGEVSATWTTRYRFGPYLRDGFPAMKIGPKAGSADVFLGSGALSYLPGRNEGWIYNPTTGEIIANYPGAVDALRNEAVADALPSASVNIKLGPSIK
ncbi:MAG: prepilin-type N-terminal cleavage/methylation domain-containing protein [Phycisphaerae bacterium]